jgi:hypothetical protein
MSITIESQLQRKLDQAAQRLGKPAEEIAEEAIRTRLEELDIQTLAEEERAYQRLYSTLRERYFQQYVAIYQGQVADSDPDFEELFLRLQKKFGDQVILIRQVNDSRIDEYHFRTVLNRLHINLDGPAATTEIVEDRTI